MMYRGEETSIGRVEWVEKMFSYLKDGSGTSKVWFGDISAV